MKAYFNVNKCKMEYFTSDIDSLAKYQMFLTLNL